MTAEAIRLFLSRRYFLKSVWGPQNSVSISICWVKVQCRSWFSSCVAGSVCLRIANKWRYFHSHKAQLHWAGRRGNKYPMDKTGMSWKSFAGTESDVGLRSCWIYFSSSLLLPAFLQDLLIREIKELGVVLWKMDQHLLSCSLSSLLLPYCLFSPHSTKVRLYCWSYSVEGESAAVLPDHRNSGCNANNLFCCNANN